MKKRSKKLLLVWLWLQLPVAARAAEHLTVLLDWFVNPNHGPLIVAREMGAFARRGLEVSFVPPADPTMPPRLLAAGQADIAVSYQPALYQQVAQGLPVIRIGSLIDRSLQSLETIEGDGVTRLADLKGKRIGFNNVTGNVNLAEIATMLQGAGVSLQDTTLVNVGTALTTSLLTHRIDAMGLDRNFEHFELIEKGARPIAFDYVKYGVPESEDLIFEANSAHADDPRLPRFLAAVREGAAFIKAHPEQAWQMFVHAYPDLDNALNHASWDYTVPYFSADPAALDAAKYRAYETFLLNRHLLKQSLPLSRYAVQLH